MSRTSRLSGWHRRTPEQRRADLSEWLDDAPAAVNALLDSGGLDLLDADRLLENVVGLYSLPFAVAPNFLIDGRELLVPMVGEEPSVVAAAGNAARIVRAGGGFRTQLDPPLMIAQVQLRVADAEAAELALREATPELLERAAQSCPGIVRRGGGPREIALRHLDDPGPGVAWLVLHLIVDVQDAMGANLVNTMAEAIAPRVEELTGGRVGLRILSNLSDRRLARVWATVPFDALGGRGVAEGIVEASRFAELDPYRAATHNKGIFNGLDAVLLATGNDWRAVEAGGHAYAARSAQYGPLCTWRLSDDGELLGYLELPLAVGVVGGATRAHPSARLALRILGVEGWEDLARAAAAAGMASNLAALKALATEGIQRGHMRLHARRAGLEEQG